MAPADGPLLPEGLWETWQMQRSRQRARGLSAGGDLRVGSMGGSLAVCEPHLQ